MKLVIGLCAVALTICACDVLISIRQAVDAVPGQVAELQKAALAEIDKQASGLRHNLDGQITAISSHLDSQLSGARQDFKDSVFLAVSPIQGIREDLAPTLAHVEAITGHVDQAASLSPELARNALGAVAAFKVTSGELTKTAIDFRRATPGILEMVSKVGANSDAATVEAIGTARESRRLVKNLADNTTPLPKWIRYPAQVIGLVGSAAVPVVTLEKLSTISK